MRVTRRPTARWMAIWGAPLAALVLAGCPGSASAAAVVHPRARASLTARVMVGHAVASRLGPAPESGPASHPWPVTGRELPLRASGQVSGGSAYTGVTPRRLLDTRVSGSPLGPGGVVSIPVAGVDGVPSDATAVAVNLTATGTTAASFLSAYPSGASRPLVSDLNWTAGRTVANLAVVPLGAGGAITVYNLAGRTDVVADLQGYFAPEAAGSTAGSYVALSPARLADTRPGSAQPDSGRTLAGGSTLAVQVTGAGSVPTGGVSAAVLNVTVTDTTAAGFLTAWPSGASRPLASNVNWPAGATVANRVIVPVGPSGQVELYDSAGRADVVVDVSGYFTDGTTTPTGAGLFTPVAPIRVLDTRSQGAPIGAGATRALALRNVAGIGADATAVIANLTATDGTAASYLTAYPGAARPTASDLNWSPGATVANLGVLSLSAGGVTDFYNYAGVAELIVDATGYFSPVTSTSAAAPTPLAVRAASLPAGTVGSAYSAQLSSTGGTAPYTWRVASGSLAAGLSLSTSGVISGTPTTAGTSQLTVEVTDSGVPSPQAASATVTISVAAATPTTPTTPSTSTTPTTPTSTTPTSTTPTSTSPTPATPAMSAVTPMPASSAVSTNWSGYITGSGPYQAVTGTFTVPSLTSVSSGSYLAEWVGIDGAGNSDLIQAGVAESPDPSSPGNYQVWPWWEILPAQSTPIDTMTVAPGDSVTVTISELDAATGAWQISVTDNTTHQDFLVDQTYSGPAATAEWIVEAPTVSNSQSTAAAYTPVTFSGLGINGPEAGLTDVSMQQQGATVSVPSRLTASGFAVAYGSTPPPAP